MARRVGVSAVDILFSHMSATGLASSRGSETAMASADFISRYCWTRFLPVLYCLLYAPDFDFNTELMNYRYHFGTIDAAALLDYA